MKIRVAAVQFAAGQDVEANLKTALRMIDQCAQACSPKLMVLPEFSNHCSWYDNKEHCYKVSVPVEGPFLKAVAEKAKEHNCFIAINCTVQREEGIATGTSLLYSPEGKLLGEKDKEVLMGHENDFLRRAKAAGPIIETEIGRLGLYSCMDGVIMETTRGLALRGGQVLCNSLNSFAWDEGSLHIPVRAGENKVFIVAANKVGPLIPEALMGPVSQATSIPEHHLHGSGESQIVAPDGTVLAMAPRTGEAFIYADIDPSEADRKTRPDGTDIFVCRRPDLYKPINEETPIAEPPELAEDIKAVVYQPKKDGVEAIEEVCALLKTQLKSKYEDPHVLTLPELFCFENASVKDLKGAVSRSEGALREIQAALKESGCQTLVITTLVEQHGEEHQHVGVAVRHDGVVLRQAQVHRTQRHAWSKPGDDFAVSKQAWGNLAIVVGDDSIYPETFRMFIFKNVNFFAVPTHITETWELTTGLLERSAENRAAVVVASRKSLPGDDSCCRIFNPFVDFTLMVPWPNRPFDGLISQPRADSTLSSDGAIFDKAVNIKGSQNKVISSQTNLVLSRPIGNLEALISHHPVQRSIQ